MRPATTLPKNPGNEKLKRRTYAERDYYHALGLAHRHRTQPHHTATDTAHSHITHTQYTYTVHIHSTRHSTQLQTPHTATAPDVRRA